LTAQIPGQVLHEAYTTAMGYDDAAPYADLSPNYQRAYETSAKTVIRECAPAELAAAMAETRRVRDVACKLIDLFSAPDGRRMRHASVTAATIERYAAEAGVRP
jgi:hypothetical protein